MKIAGIPGWVFGCSSGVCAHSYDKIQQGVGFACAFKAWLADSLGPSERLFENKVAHRAQFPVSQTVSDIFPRHLKWSPTRHGAQAIAWGTKKRSESVCNGNGGPNDSGRPECPWVPWVKPPQEMGSGAPVILWMRTAVSGSPTNFTSAFILSLSPRKMT